MKESIHPSTEKFTSGTHIPFWMEQAPLSYDRLALDKETDVVIVGGGIAGVSVAYHLCLAGLRVVLVEDGFIGSGESGRTTAHLVTVLDDRYYDLERMFGEEKTKLIANSHANAIAAIEKAIHRENIDCDFKRLDGYLFLHPTDKESSLDEEYEAARRAGLYVEKVASVPGMHNKTNALVFRNQAQFHSIKYLKGLCDAIVRRGGAIYTNTQAVTIDEKGIVTGDGYKVSAKYVVVATNSPVNNKYAIHVKQYSYRSYVIGAKIEKGALPSALWWDTGDFSVNKTIPPYHYVRQHPYNETHDLLIIGGEDHAVGMADTTDLKEGDRYTVLEAWARHHFPAMEEVIYNWSGEIRQSMDAVGYIGRNPMDSDNIFVVTGDSGTGMTHGTIAGILITDLIRGRDNEWADVYEPSRFKLFSAGKVFFKEFVGGLFEYLRSKPDTSGIQPKDIAPGDGKVIEINGRKYGAYRDEQNFMHFVAAECTHLGCIIRWNSDEKSWDCPCHGSRFTPEGNVLNGPANSALMYHKERVI